MRHHPKDPQCHTARVCVFAFYLCHWERISTGVYNLHGLLYRRNSKVQSLVASYEAYEDLVKKAEEGKSFYQDLEKKTSGLLDRVKTICQSREDGRAALVER